MSFIWSSLLGLLLLVPVLVLVYVLMQKRRQDIVAKSGFGLVQTTNVVGMRRHYPAMVFLLGLTILLFSLARPQASVILPKYDGTVILVFDVSGSMAAEDIAPTRMEAAKAIASDFVNGQPADVRIGVVAFSDG